MRIIRFGNLRRLLSLIIISCSAFVTQQNFALEGGQSVNASNYPGLVMLSYGGNSQFTNCSGIVLQSKRILTSVNCVYHFSNLIPASDIYVHRIINGQSSGNVLLPPLKPSTSDARVVSYNIHPQNPFSSGHHNLVVLYLNRNINLTPAVLYNGQNKYSGTSSTALGWTREQGRREYPFPQTYYFYLLNKLSFKLIDGNTNINGLCYDNYNYTGTVFCGGFRNSTNFMQSHDYGAPIYKTINGKITVIGLLTSSSGGTQFEGQFQYERYARISSMVDFIKQHAPNTQFWNESNVSPKSPPSIIPILQMLLLDQ